MGITPADRTEKTTPQPQVAVLAYHKIGQSSGRDTWFYVPEELFARQLSCIAQSGWQVIDAARFLRGLNHPGTLPDRSVLLTFDDGYRSILRCALPHLRAFGFPAVIFVPTDFVGDVSRFDAGTREPMEPICSWEELKQLQRSAVSVESHGASHCKLFAVDQTRLISELESSRNAILRELGTISLMFAFPYGDSGSDWQTTVNALRGSGYHSAFLYGGGVQSFPVDEPYRIARIPMGRETQLEQILTSHALTERRVERTHLVDGENAATAEKSS